MPSLTPADLSKRLRNEPADRLYYLYGQDTGALQSFASALINKLCPKADRTMNLHKFSGADLDVNALYEACEMLPMFAQRVVVTVNDLNMDSPKIGKSAGDRLRTFLADLPETTTVIIYSTGVDLYKNKRSLTDKNKRFSEFCAKHGVSCEFAFKTTSEMGKGIAAAVNKAGCSSTKGDSEYLAECCLCDTSQVRQEIVKLTSYAAGRQITRADIDALCIKKVESDGFALAKSILSSRAVFVFNRIRELADQNYEAFEILGTISFSLNDLYRARLAMSSGRSQQAVIQDFKYPKNREFSVRNAFNEVQNVSLPRMRKVIRIFSDTDLYLKTRSQGRQADMLYLEEAAARAMSV